MTATPPAPLKPGDIIQDALGRMEVVYVSQVSRPDPKKGAVSYGVVGTRPA